jgi:hypothetical protein
VLRQPDVGRGGGLDAEEGFTEFGALCRNRLNEEFRYSNNPAWTCFIAGY